MSYGLQVYRSYGTATLFDTSEDSRGTFLVDAGTVSLNSALTYKAGDIVLFRPSGTVNNNTHATIIAKTTRTSGTGQSAQFSTTFSRPQGNFTPTIAYVILRDFNQSSGATSVGDYGILCLSLDGSVAITNFDSRKFTAQNEFVIDELFTSTGSLAHGQTLHSHANDGRYFAVPPMDFTNLTNFIRRVGYCWDRGFSSSVIIWNGASASNGRVYSNAGSTGRVVGISELNQGPGGYLYNVSLQPYFSGVFKGDL